MSIIAEKKLSVFKYRSVPGTVKESNLAAVVMPNSIPIRIDDLFNCEKCPGLINAPKVVRVTKLHPRLRPPNTPRQSSLFRLARYPHVLLLGVAACYALPTRASINRSAGLSGRLLVHFFIGPRPPWQHHRRWWHPLQRPRRCSWRCRSSPPSRHQARQLSSW